MGEGVTQRFNVAEEWVRVSAPGAFTLRAPAQSTDGLWEFGGIGTCLEPLIREGDTKYFDPRLEPADGDFVCVQWDPDDLADIIERARQRGGDYWQWWLRTYGEQPGPYATKWLRHFGRDHEAFMRGERRQERWLVTNGSMLPLGRNRILGTLRRVERNGVSLYESPVAQMISLNAATDLYQTSDPSEAVTTSGGGVDSRSFQVYVTFTPPVDCEFLVRASFRAQVSGGAGGFTANAHTFRSRTDGSNQANGPIHTITALSGADPPADVTIQHKFAVTAGIAFRGGLQGNITTLANSGTLTFTDINIVVELIKR